jgi:RNA polymerase sigma-70 factor (ECF subfamily)
MQPMCEKTFTLSWGAPMNGERTAASGDADGVLIARFLAGDRGAFDTLFDKYQDYVYNIVHGIVGRADESRDITQDVFVQVFRSLSSFRRGARFATWLYRIAVNRAVDAARGARGWRWLSLDATMRTKPDPADNPAQQMDRQAEKDAVQAVLMQLAVQHRDILVLRYYQDLSIEEISEVLGCSVPAAKVRLHRARQHFKERYIATYGRENGSLEPLC